MRVVIERSGGVAGIRVTQSVSTDKMPADQAQQLNKLIGVSNFYQLPSVIDASGPVADTFQYKIALDGERGSHSVRVNKGAVPAGLHSLLDWMKCAAKSRTQTRPTNPASERK